MIRTTYPDRICYRPRCDAHECRVLLPEGVRIGERATCSLRESGWSCSGYSPCHQGEGSLHHAHADSHPCDVPSSPDIPHPEFWRSDVPHSLDISHPAPNAGWERRAFQLFQIYISGSSDSVHSESFGSHFAQCRDVLLKLPDMCDRHFEIFFCRYLLSKSPNSPCNPPIIGFLSL